jgi:hypothetical protein
MPRLAPSSRRKWVWVSAGNSLTERDLLSIEPPVGYGLR